MSPSAVLGLVLFSTFTNNMDSRTESSLSKSVYDTKMSGAVDTPEGWDAIHRKLDKLKQWAHKNLISFNKIKSKVLCLGQGNPRQKHRLREVTESSPVEEDLGYRPDMTWQYALAAQEANCVLGCIQSSVASRARRGFCSSALRPHLQCCIQLWGPQHGLVRASPQKGHKDQRAGAPPPTKTH
ncbi:hypothetical protein DUI87_25046 [Hirundo rustica rustica]|uniref:Rna-directed dna polymerase from mobile element jockey-like n=1 Tax=Hirundo rustica rustica TaxID=333673 RepID=A0A3M0JCD1_HIRRU|nr:hypothetical protein DUI87_25046 [Hirundo rustica rustica]